MSVDGRSSVQPGRALPAWVLLLVGAAAGALGLLPWVRTGGRLLVQNLWATDVAADQLPRVLLPFSQYTITLVIGVLVTGSAAAGLVVRALGARVPPRGALAAFVGLVVVQVLALVQTTRVVRAGLREGHESALYLAVLVGVAGLSVAVGAVTFWLVARAPRGGAVLGLCVGALASGPWLGGLVVPPATVSPSPVAVSLLGTVRWVPAILVGVAIGWGGVRTAGRVVAAVLGLALVWIVPALTTAIANAAGSRVLAHDRREMAAYAGEVFVAASTTAALVVPPLVVAVAVAAVVGLGGRFLRRRQLAT